MVTPYISEVTPKGNSSYSYTSQEDADMNARELDSKGCISCVGCINCDDCIDCINCNNCIDCYSCDTVMNEQKESDLR